MDNKGQCCRGLQHEKATKEKDTESLQPEMRLETESSNAKAASMTCHVNVKLKKDGRYEWRQVEAPTLREAMAVAERMPDVAMCVEASTVPGGVAT